jgi:hypothetical protein
MTEIPQDFIDIDANADHWVMTGVSGPNEGRRFPDPDLFCVPSTNAKSDMTEAMLSEIPGQDDTVTPLKLEEQRFYKFCMAFLMQDGNLGVPGGRYGRDTRDCAPIAIVMALVMRYHNGEPISYYSLNSDMGRVVNSDDGVTDLLSESQYILDDLHDSGIDVKELLGDEYSPQTPLERLAKWAEVEPDNDSVTITFDADDAERLISDIRGYEQPFGKEFE